MAEEVQGQTLSDIAKGIQHTVNTAQEVVEKYYIRLLDRYFDEQDNPKTMGINLSDDTSIDVPLIALVSPRGLELDELEVGMSLRVDGVKNKKEITKAGDEVQRASFQISFGGGKKGQKDPNMIDLSMKFKKGDSPEGVQRIIESFANRVTPKGKA